MKGFRRGFTKNQKISFKSDYYMIELQLDLETVSQSDMKKLVQINTVCNNSTGQIMHDIQEEAVEQGYDAISFVGRRKVYKDLKCEKFGNPISFWSHVVLNTLFDCQGYGSYFATKKLIRRLREEKPDIIHLHNLHGYYLHLPLLFRYLKAEFRGRLFWTFHDCWPFTGHCPHFVIAECDRWKTKCCKCPQKKSYPISLFFDSSYKNYENKKRMFTSVKDLTIITPSEWLGELAKESFFKGFNVQVVNNGIDTDIFSPCLDNQKARKILNKYNIPDNRKILLGVAGIWESRKGLDKFIGLSDLVDDSYIIVLVGLSKRRIKSMPNNIIGIEHTENKADLAVLYSMAHIFINPSMEESFSLVTVEAMACGTPVIALGTSAVKELVDADCGIILQENSVENYMEAVREIETKNLSRELIAQKALRYSKECMTKKVLELYEYTE